ncbi:MAG: chemotaxis protein CheA [Pseudomonadota bacterium]|uniref:chemotaxis protein CheA n=1 Tax=uncultured Sphingomonas sp. TaxID=158754 RepID=UPI0030F6EA80
MSDEMDEIQGIFFEECAEGLAVAEQGLSAMRAGDLSSETIAGVFRAVHSIKGGAGAFGHAALTAFAHRFENVMDEVRAGRIPATPGVTDVMLSAFDILTDHVAAARGTAPLPQDSAVLAALENVLETKGVGVGGGATAAPAPATPDAPQPEAEEGDEDEFGFRPVGVALDIFDATEEPVEPDWIIDFAPSHAALANGGEPLLLVREVEALGGSIVSVDLSALPPLREMEPEQSYLRWTIRVPASIEEAALTDCFDFVAPDSLVSIARAESVVPATSAAATDPLDQTSDDIADAEPELSAPVLTLVSTTAPSPSAPTLERASEPAAQTIRVDLIKLDLLLNLVGELVIRNSILADRLTPADQQRVELPELARLTRQIQDNVMSLRAQPIRQAFSRVPRMLRDLSAETGKQVILETTGETTEVDKGVIEKIGDPLTHMIRNAIDHGIEPPADRIAKGKEAQGTIRLSAEQKGARIFVRVADDGRGIDRVRVRAKAIEKGIIQADAQLTDEEIDQLICAPGFSTAETISNISGRGVGMDVVRSNVEALGGRVEIASTPGEGTTFTMILPLTLAILDGMIVRLGGQRYVLPLANVIETVQPAPGQVKRTSPTNEVIDMRGQYLPVKRATDIFDLPGSNRTIEDSLVVIVESESAGHVGLIVDTIDDRREVVIKSLDQNLYPIRGLGGATILGDGSIALILDIEALVASNSFNRFTPKGIAA